MRLKFRHSARSISVLALVAIGVLACATELLGQQTRRSASRGALIVDLPSADATEPVVQVAAKPLVLPVEVNETLQHLLVDGPQQDVPRSDVDGSVGPVLAEQVDGLTVESLEAIATNSNPSILRASAEIAAARGRAYQAGLRPNPAVGFDFQQLGSDGLAEQYGVLVQQEVVRGQKLQLNRSIALHEVAALEQAWVAQRQRVLTDVRIAYVRALRATKQLKLSKQLVEIGRQAIDVSKELLNIGEISRAELLQAEIEVESAEIVLRNAENNQKAVWRELAAVIGKESLQVQPLAGNLSSSGDDLQFEQSLQSLLSKSPEVAALFSEIERARCNLKRQQAEVKPNVTVQGLINWRDNGIGGGPDGAITVAMPLPLWNKNQGAIREARHQLDAAQHALIQVELELKQRLTPVFQQYRNSQEEVRRYEARILPKIAETLELTRKAYELGQLNFTGLLLVQRTYANTQLAHLEAQEQLRIAQLRIGGMLLSGSFSTRTPVARKY
ncbi:TolC family protein [bacterium]|nr:TolC family protein [bacterium]